MNGSNTKSGNTKVTGSARTSVSKNTNSVKAINPVTDKSRILSTNGHDDQTTGVKQPWGQSTLTDDRWADVMQCNPPSCIPLGCIKPEQHFACDRQVAKLLAQYVSPEERKKVFQWLDTLEKMTLDEDELSERSMYLTCLVMLLKTGQLVPPFTRSPCPRPLKQLRDVIDSHLFKKVLVECRKRRTYEVAEYEQPDRSVYQRPSEFFSQMPEPANGMFCYGAAFSMM